MSVVTTSGSKVAGATGCSWMPKVPVARLTWWQAADETGPSGSVLGERDVAVVDVPTGVAPDLGRRQGVAGLTPDNLAVIGPALFVEVGQRSLAGAAAGRTHRVIRDFSEQDRLGAGANRVPTAST